jgi:hypothetical protein
MPKTLGTNEWLSKVVKDDVPLLEKIAASPRVESLVVRAYRLTRPGKPTEVALAIPEDRKKLPWKPAILIGEGLKLGGKKALSSAGFPIFKGQNIFASGLKGQPMGYWDGDPKRPQSPKIYLYHSLFKTDSLFAARKIVQLPTIYKVTGDEVFQNSTILIQLTRYLPLHKWTLSRPIQWFAAKTMRAGIIEDLAGTWMGREYLRLPVPANATDEQLAMVEQTGTDLLHADEDIADARRHVRAAIEAAPSSTLRLLIINGDCRISGLDLGDAGAVAVPLAGVRAEGETIVGDDLLLHITVPDAGLRIYLAYLLAEMSAEDDELELSPSDILDLSVPNDLGEVVAEIERWQSGNREAQFSQAHRALDQACGEVLGLTEEEVDHIIKDMSDSPFLSEIKPMYSYRGFRQQPYSDREGRNILRLAPAASWLLRYPCTCTSSPSPKLRRSRSADAVSAAPASAAISTRIQIEQVAVVRPWSGGLLSALAAARRPTPILWVVPPSPMRTHAKGRA